MASPPAPSRSLPITERVKVVCLSFPISAWGSFCAPNGQHLPVNGGQFFFPALLLLGNGPTVCPPVCLLEGGKVAFSGTCSLHVFSWREKRVRERGMCSPPLQSLLSFLINECNDDSVQCERMLCYTEIVVSFPCEPHGDLSK